MSTYAEALEAAARAGVVSETVSTTPATSLEVGAVPQDPPRQRIVHMSASVRGLLNWPDKKLRGLLRMTTTRRWATPAEARSWLQDQLAAGFDLIPYGGKCDGFDPKNGCPGHEVTRG